MEITKQYSELLNRYNLKHGEVVNKPKCKATFKVVGYSYNPFGTALILAPDRYTENSWTLTTTDDHIDKNIECRNGYVYAIDVIKI